jgi:hypothetical protein
MNSQSTVGKATEAAASITGRRYCSHHQGEVPIDEGSFVMRNTTKRWICNRCQEKSERRRAEILADKS